MADPMRAHRRRQGKSADNLAAPSNYPLAPSYTITPGEVVIVGGVAIVLHSSAASRPRPVSFKIAGAPGLDFVSCRVHVCTRL